MDIRETNIYWTLEILRNNITSIKCFFSFHKNNTSLLGLALSEDSSGPPAVAQAGSEGLYEGLDPVVSQDHCLGHAEVEVLCPGEWDPMGRC